MSHMKCVLLSMRTPEGPEVFVKREVKIAENGDFSSEISWVNDITQATQFDMLEDTMTMGDIIMQAHHWAKAFPNNYLFSYIETRRIRE